MATAYEFACGAMERREVSEGTSGHLYREHGIYHVTGFCRGKHMTNDFRNLTEARKFLRQLTPTGNKLCPGEHVGRQRQVQS